MSATRGLGESDRDTIAQALKICGVRKSPFPLKLSPLHGSFSLSLPQFAEVKNGSVCKKCLRKARAVVKAAATFRSLVSKKKIFRFGTNTSAEFTFTYPPSQTEGSVPSSQPAEPEPPSQRVRQPAPSGRVFIRSTKLPVSETFSFEVAT